MDSGFYAAVTGLVASSDALDLLADNLSNSATTGYKAQREFYQALNAAGAGLSPLNQAINNYGILGGAETDLRPGSIEKTGNQLDLALEGQGFFTIETAAGVRYTRNGSLRVSAGGELQTADGSKVLAVPENPKAAPGHITVPEGTLSISADGTISSQGAVVAQLNLVDFPHGTALTSEGGTVFAAPAGAAQPAAEPSVHQGALESSNFNPVQGTVDLITLQRHAQLLERALSIFDSDFAQAAASELPRVGP